MAEFLSKVVPLLFLLWVPIVVCSPISFSFSDFGPSSPRQHLLLLGDARFSSSSSSVWISGSSPSSSGCLLFSCPLSSLDALSFSTSFSFSMLAHHGHGFAFVLLPITHFRPSPGPSLGLPSSPHLQHTLAVEFDSTMNPDVQDLTANHVGFDFGSLVSVVAANLSSIDIILNSGQQFFSWIDYHSPSKLLEVRISKSQTQRPDRPLLSHHIDLSSLWDREMYVGFTSSTGASPQKHTLHSWTFHSWDGSQHSLPVDPSRLAHPPNVHEFLRIAIGGLIGMAMGSAVAVSMVALWVLVRRILKPSPAELAMHPIIFGYQQIITDEK